LIVDRLWREHGLGKLWHDVHILLLVATLAIPVEFFQEVHIHPTAKNEAFELIVENFHNFATFPSTILQQQTHILDSDGVDWTWVFLFTEAFRSFVLNMTSAIFSFSDIF